MQIDIKIKEELKNWPKIVGKYQKPKTSKAVGQLLNTFLPFIALWVLMYLSLSISYWLTFGLTIVGGFLMARIFIIQHDCGHNSFTKSKKWNTVIGYFCSFFSTIPFQYWAKTHAYHHSHTGQLEHRDIGDIDFLTVNEFRKLSKWGKIKYRIFRHPVVLFFVVPIYYLAIAVRIPKISVKSIQKQYLSQQLNNLALVGVYLLIAYLVGWKAFFFIHLTTVMFFGIIAFWFFYVQHQHDHSYQQWKDKWDYLLASIKGATYYKLPRLFQWLTGNIGFHHIHHLNHRIPNYNLEKCYNENPVLNKYVTTITFWPSLKMMFNKLWDEERQEMITFRKFKKLESQRQMAA